MTILFALNCLLGHRALKMVTLCLCRVRRVMEARITSRRDRDAARSALRGWQGLCAELRHGRCHAEALHAERTDAQMVSSHAAGPHLNSNTSRPAPCLELGFACSCLRPDCQAAAHCVRMESQPTVNLLQAAVFSAWDEEIVHEKQRLASTQLALGRRQRRVRQRMCLTGWRQKSQSALILQRVSAG